MSTQSTDLIQQKPISSKSPLSLHRIGIFGGITLSIACSFILPGNLFAAEASTEEWNITADKILHFDNPRSIVAKGDVVLVKKEKLPLHTKKKEQKGFWSTLLGEEEKEPTAEQLEEKAAPQYKTTVTINADWIAYDMEKKSIKAKGHLRIATPEDQLQAKEGSLDLESETGKFTEAIIVRKENELHLEGKSIAKTGENTYTIEDGWAVTCKVEDGKTPPWSIASSTTKITPGGYAVLTNARFRIHDIPVFYTPYLILPVKNTRQTGLLFPEFSYSSNGGFGAGVPLFINISDSADMTLYPTLFAKRGVMGGAEFRYATSEQSKGMFVGNYLHDKLSDPEETAYYEDTGYTHTTQNRYWVRGKADHTFGDGWISRLDMDLVSDEDYLREFDFGSTGFNRSQRKFLDMFGRGFEEDTDRTRNNSFKLLKSWGGISFEANLLAIDDLNQEGTEVTTTVTDALGNSTTTESISFEEVTAGTTVDPVTGETTTISTQKSATPLWKLPELDFDGTIDTGLASITFDWETNYVHYWREEGIGGSRIDIRPSISSPLHISPYLESRAKFSLRNTHYMIKEYGDAKWEEDDSQNRFYPELEVNLATTLQRDFGTGTGAPLRHEMRPFVKYFYIPEIDGQDELPQWDSLDSISELNRITYGVDNLFSSILKSTNGKGLENLFTTAGLHIEQSYDLSNVSDDEPFSDIYTNFFWTPSNATRLNYKVYYDVYDNDVNNHNIEGIYKWGAGDYLGAEYSFDKVNDLEQVNAWAQMHLLAHWILGGRVEYSLANEETNEARASLSYQAQCWTVKFETRYTPEDTAYMMFFELANIGAKLGFDI